MINAPTAPLCSGIRYEPGQQIAYTHVFTLSLTSGYGTTNASSMNLEEVCLCWLGQLSPSTREYLHAVRVFPSEKCIATPLYAPTMSVLQLLRILRSKQAHFCRQHVQCSPMPWPRSLFSVGARYFSTQHTEVREHR